MQLVETSNQHYKVLITPDQSVTPVLSIGTKGFSQLYHLSFDDNKVLKLSIGYAKSLFKCTRPLSKIYL